MIEFLEFCTYLTDLTKRWCPHFTSTISGHAETCTWCGSRRTTFIDRGGEPRVSPWRRA